MPKLYGGEQLRNFGRKDIDDRFRSKYQSPKTNTPVLVQVVNNDTQIPADDYKTISQQLDTNGGTTQAYYTVGKRFLIKEMYIFGARNPASSANNAKLIIGSSVVWDALTAQSPTPAGSTTNIIGYFQNTIIPANVTITFEQTTNALPSGYYIFYIKGFYLD